MSPEPDVEMFEDELFDNKVGYYDDDGNNDPNNNNNKQASKKAKRVSTLNFKRKRLLRQQQSSLQYTFAFEEDNQDDNDDDDSLFHNDSEEQNGDSSLLSQQQEMATKRKRRTIKNLFSKSAWSRNYGCALIIIFIVVVCPILACIGYAMYDFITRARAAHGLMFGGRGNNNNNDLNGTAALFQSPFFTRVLGPHLTTVLPFRRRDSPQFRALKTLLQYETTATIITTTNDPNNVTTIDADIQERLLQRYAMWTLWFAAHERYQCNTTTNDTRTNNNDDVTTTTTTTLQKLPHCLEPIWRLMTRQHECLWIGVGCIKQSLIPIPSKNRRRRSPNERVVVTLIQMSHFNLTGHLPWIEIEFFLPHLKMLDVSRNNLRGTMSPSLLVSLPQLEVLNLGHNQFRGDMGQLLSASLPPPPRLPLSVTLDELAKGGTITENNNNNNTNGDIPPRVVIVKQLRVLKLQSNRLEGFLSSEFFWSIMTNDESSSMGSFLFPFLSHVDLSWNLGLQGTISPTATSMLQGLDNANTLLHIAAGGDHDSSTISSLTRLEFMSLVGTQITGIISSAMCPRRRDDNDDESTVSTSLSNTRTATTTTTTSTWLIQVDCQNIICACCQDCPIIPTTTTTTIAVAPTKQDTNNNNINQTGNIIPSLTNDVFGGVLPSGGAGAANGGSQLWPFQFQETKEHEQTKPPQDIFSQVQLP